MKAGLGGSIAASDDDIGKSFPDLLAAMDFEGVIDGELLVKQAGGVALLRRFAAALNRLQGRRCRPAAEIPRLRPGL